jgi:hypothetical protein
MGKTGPQAGDEATYPAKENLSAADSFWQCPEPENRSKEEIRI